MKSEIEEFLKSIEIPLNFNVTVNPIEWGDDVGHHSGFDTDIYIQDNVDLLIYRKLLIELYSKFFAEVQENYLIKNFDLDEIINRIDSALKINDNNLLIHYNLPLDYLPFYKAFPEYSDNNKKVGLEKRHSDFINGYNNLRHDVIKVAFDDLFKLYKKRHDYFNSVENQSYFNSKKLDNDELDVSKEVFKDMADQKYFDLSRLDDFVKTLAEEKIDSPIDFKGDLNGFYTFINELEELNLWRSKYKWIRAAHYFTIKGKQIDPKAMRKQHEYESSADIKKILKSYYRQE